MTNSIFSNLPNNLIMNIIKMAEDERKNDEEYEQRWEEEEEESIESYRERSSEWEYNNPPEDAYDWGDEPQWA